MQAPRRSLFLARAMARPGAGLSVSALLGLSLGCSSGDAANSEALSNTPAESTPGGGSTPAQNMPTGTSTPSTSSPAGNGTSSAPSGTTAPVVNGTPSRPAAGGEDPSAGNTPITGTETPAPGTTGGVSPATCDIAGAASATTPTIWVIGDSTASVYASDLYPRTGWAQPLQDYFAPACATTRDMARSGRSSKSFFDEGAWTPVRDGLKSGDFVLIQFGHNDEKIEDPLRGTDPFTTFQQHLSTYIDDTLAKQATPVLLTPIQRNQWTGLAIRDTHGSYPVAVRQLAEARQVALIDAGDLTKRHFEAIGQAATTALFMDLAVGQFPNYPDGNSDQTHLQESGARTVADLILSDAARQGLAFGALVKAAVASPLAAPSP